MSNTTLRPVLAAAGAAVLVTSGVMPHVISRLRRRGHLDHPNERSSHVEPTPRGGGLACAAGLFAGLCAAKAAGAPLPSPAIVGTAALSAVGFVDDRVGLPASARLGAQAIAGLFVGGVVGGSVSASVLGAATVPAVVNSFNFMDGVNGISAGQITVWAGSAVPLLIKSGATSDAVFAASAMGAGVSFIPWNFPSALVFLGDIGSYLFGSVIAFTSISVATRDRGTAIRILAPYLLYLGDTGWTLIRRWKSGQRLTEAHREHVYQRLVDFDGIDHWHVAVVVSVGSALSAALGRRKQTTFALPLLIAGYLSLPRLRLRAQRSS